MSRTIFVQMVFEKSCCLFDPCIYCHANLSELSISLSDKKTDDELQELLEEVRFSIIIPY